MRKGCDNVTDQEREAEHLRLYSENNLLRNERFHTNAKLAETQESLKLSYAERGELMRERDQLRAELARERSAALARELIAAARPAYAFKDSGAHERLQKRFKMAGWQTMAVGQGFGRDRIRPGMERHINNGGDGQHAATGE